MLSRGPASWGAPICRTLAALCWQDWHKTPFAIDFPERTTGRQNKVPGVDWSVNRQGLQLCCLTWVQLKPGGLSPPIPHPSMPLAKRITGVGQRQMEKLIQWLHPPGCILELQGRGGRGGGFKERTDAPAPPQTNNQIPE